MVLRGPLLAVGRMCDSGVGRGCSGPGLLLGPTETPQATRCTHTETHIPHLQASMCVRTKPCMLGRADPSCSVPAERGHNARLHRQARSLTQVPKAVHRAPCEASPSQPPPGRRGPEVPAPPHCCSEGAGGAHSVVRVPQGLRQDLSSTCARDSPACTQPPLTCGLGVWAARPRWQPCASAA